MSLLEVVMEGTLKPDGTLVLDQKPSLAPGRVKVILQRSSEPKLPLQEGWWQFMQRARKQLEESGAAFMNDEELQSHIEWLREGDRIDDLLREGEAEGRKREP